MRMEKILMGKKYIMVGSLLLSMLMLTGCSKGAKIKDTKEIEKENIVNLNDVDSGNEIKEDNITIEPSDSKSIEVKVDMGEIKIKSGDVNEVIVDTKYKVENAKAEIKKQILDAVTVISKEEGNRIIIAAVHKDTKEDIWKWIRDNFQDKNGSQPNLSVYLDITVPEDIKEYQVNNAMGDIVLENLNGLFKVNNAMGSIILENLAGSFNINNAMGKIKLENISGDFNINNAMGEVILRNVEFKGNSKIVVNMGDIDCKLSKSITENANIQMIVDMGDIGIDLNGHTYSKEDDGDNFMGAECTITVEDKWIINAKVSQGDIKINK